MPPSRLQIRLALGIVVALVAAFGVTAAFTHIQLPRVDAFIPALSATIIFNDLITSALLFAQFSVARRLALLVLASGYLFTAMIVVPYTLTFPGSFAPTGLLGAGLQSTVWLYIFWHAGLPLAILVYVSVKDARGGGNTSQHSPVVAIGWSIAVVIATVCALTWVATAGNDLLPSIFLDSVHMNPGRGLLFSGLLALLTAVALTMLWLRWRSVLDLWLMVMCCTWLLEITLVAVLIEARFSLGWYAGRLYALMAAIFVLLVLLSETTTLYAHLARSVMRQRGNREARQVAMDAMAASIAHEVNQPLAANALNSRAALRFLAQTPPNIDEVRNILEGIARDSVRGGEVVASLRAMFKKDTHGRILLSVNDLIREVLIVVDVDLRSNRVSVASELREGLPRLLGDKSNWNRCF